MFSDRRRGLKILLLGLFLAASCVYAQFSSRELDYEDCLADPEKYAGAEVWVGRDLTIGAVEPGRFRVRGPGEEFSVEVPGGTEGLGLRTGDYFQAITVFRPRDGGGYLELREIRTAPRRRLKILVSVLPVLLVGLLLVRCLRWKNGFLAWKDAPGEVRRDA